MKSQNVLSKIIQQKKMALKRRIEEMPLAIVKKRADNIKTSLDILEVISNINHENDLALICEFKPGSPSKGPISSFLISDIIHIYQKNGAALTSVLTEEKFFQSHLENLEIARQHSEIPLLRKDFLFDEYQIYESKAAGANSVLLMVGVYPHLKDGINLCRDLEMEPLVECHNRQDIHRANAYGAQLIGINNRNLNDLSVDLNRTRRLAAEVPEDRILISESGVKGTEDVKFLAKSGADAVLAGTCLMECSNLNQVLESVKNLVESTKGVRQGR